MKAGVLTQLRLIALLSSLLFLWDDKTTLAGSAMHSKGNGIVGETHDNRELPKFLVLDKPSGRKSLIEIEGKTRRIESIQKHKGKYTKGCRDVTIGECSIPLEDLCRNDTLPTTPQICQDYCFQLTSCNVFRFDGHNCSQMTNQYQRNCNVYAGPPDTMVYDCIGIGPKDQLDQGVTCNLFLQEDCEYLGETLDDTTDAIDNNILCQIWCERWSGCKYWIYHEDKKRCILKKDSRRNCKTWGGKKTPEFDYCRDALKVKLKEI